MEEFTENVWPFPNAGHTHVLVTESGQQMGSEQCQGRHSLFLRYVVLALFGITLYASTIAIDILVAIEDIEKGNPFYATINLVLVATPSVLYGLYMSLTTYMKHSYWNAALWLLFIPLVPLFPLMRIPVRIYHALAAACSTSKKSLHISMLTKPSSAHLLKFMQAMVTSAPQLVLRLHKLLGEEDNNKLFANPGLFSPLEWAQVGLASAAVTLTVSLAVGQALSTRELFNGHLSIETVSTGSVVLALFWWFFFLAARIPCIALLIHSFDYWSLVFLILHSLLIFAFQKNDRSLQMVRTTFIYLFSAFFFTFVNVEINLRRRMISAWIPHVLFSSLALAEQTAILCSWFLVERGIIPKVSLYPPGIFYTNETVPNTTNQTDPDYFGVIDHDEAVISVHYVLFVLSAIFMTITICCHPRLKVHATRAKETLN